MLSKTRFTALSLVMLTLLCALLAGCGGGGSGGEDQGSGGDAQQGEKNKKPKKPKKEGPETKIAIGTLAAVDAENRLISVRLAQKQDAEPMRLKVRKNAEITLGGKEAEVSGIKKGQQAQVEYIVKNDVNRALAVDLFESGGGSGGDKPGNGGG